MIKPIFAVYVGVQEVARADRQSYLSHARDTLADDEKWDMFIIPANEEIDTKIELLYPKFVILKDDEFAKEIESLEEALKAVDMTTLMIDKKMQEIGYPK